VTLDREDVEAIAVRSSSCSDYDSTWMTSSA